MTDESTWAPVNLLAQQCAVQGMATPALIERLFPLVEQLALRSRALRGSLSREDDAREIATRMVEKVSDGSSLKSYGDWQGRHPDKTFADWVRIAAANAVRDLLRSRRGRSHPPQESESEPSVKQLLNEHALLLSDDLLTTRPPFTPVHTAKQVMHYAEQKLPAAQQAALRQWLADDSFAEIAQAQGLTNELAAKKLLRAAVATLRRAFATDVEIREA